MAHIVVIGAGLGGVSAAFELRHKLSREHKITLVSNQSKFTFTPSLPWVGLGLRSLDQIQLDLGRIIPSHGIEFIPAAVTALDPELQQITLKQRTLTYDYVVIATGAELALDAIPGLGPDQGYTQSICNPHHAALAHQAWLKFLEQPGELVVGAVPGASCFGPVYEFALLADAVLRERGLRAQVPITIVTPEPYAGHLGIGGMAHSAQLVTQLLQQRQIHLIQNAAITEISSSQIVLAEGRRLPFRYAMLLPPFRGPRFLREAAALTDSQGFLPVLPTYQHPDFASIYSVGVITQLRPPEATEIPIDVPKTGQMTEAMAMAVAHNIAIKLGAIATAAVKPTLEALCLADFGNTGIAFIAAPILPDPELGRRRRAIAVQGAWVSWAKTAFEFYFLTKLRFGAAVPWFEQFGLQSLGLKLVEPIATEPKIALREY